MVLIRVQVRYVTWNMTEQDLEGTNLQAGQYVHPVSKRDKRFKNFTHGDRFAIYFKESWVSQRGLDHGETNRSSSQGHSTPFKVKRIEVGGSREGLRPFNTKNTSKQVTPFGSQGGPGGGARPSNTCQNSRVHSDGQQSTSPPIGLTMQAKGKIGTKGSLNSMLATERRQN